MKIFPNAMAAATGQLVAAAFTVDRKPLVDAMALLARVVERRNTVPVLSNVLLEFDGFDTLHLSTSDLDILATTSIAASGRIAFATTVDAKGLLDMVKKADGALLDATLLDGSLHVRSGRGASKLKTLSHRLFPMIRAKEGRFANIVTSGDSFASDLAMVAPSMSKEESRYYLCGAALQSRDDSLIMVATDGSTLAAVSKPYNGEIPDVIIPRKTVEFLVRALKGRATIAVNFDGANRHCSAGLITVATADGSLRIVSKLIDGTFPDVDRAIATAVGKAETTAIDNPTLDPRLNQAFVRNMAKGVGAPLAYAAGDKAVVVTCEQRPAFYGLIMFRETRHDAEAIADAPGTVTYTDDAGNIAAIGLGAKAEYENGPISLSAADVAKLCGPVDPSTFVPIPRLTFLHGRIIARDGIATDGTGRTVFMPLAKPLKGAKQRERDYAITHDAKAMAAYLDAHAPVYLDPPVEAPKPVLMITYQPEAAETPASACEPETAVTAGEALESLPAPETGAAPSILERLAILESALGLEIQSHGNADATNPVAHNFSVRRERMLRRYLAVRAERAALQRHLAIGQVQYDGLKEELRMAEQKAEFHLDNGQRLTADVQVERDRAKRADERAEAAEFKASELQDRLNAIALAMSAAAPAIDDAIAGKVAAVEASHAIEEAAPVEPTIEEAPSRGFVVTRVAA